jgi:hypothetical protein
MRRRDFIALSGGAAAAWPLVVRAQQGDRIRRLAVLMSVEESDPEGKAQLSGFTQALAQLGWTDGHNLRMEVRWGGGGDVNRARSFAKELVALQPEVILAQNACNGRTPTRDKDNSDRICCCHRPGRGRICYRVSSPRWKYHRLPNIRIWNYRQDAWFA